MAAPWGSGDYVEALVSETGQSVALGGLPEHHPVERQHSQAPQAPADTRQRSSRALGSTQVAPSANGRPAFWMWLSRPQLCFMATWQLLCSLGPSILNISMRTSG